MHKRNNKNKETCLPADSMHWPFGPGEIRRLVHSWRGQPTGTVPVYVRALAASLLRGNRAELESDGLLKENLDQRGQIWLMGDQLKQMVAHKAEQVKVDRDAAVREMKEVEALCQ